MKVANFIELYQIDSGKLAKVEKRKKKVRSIVLSSLKDSRKSKLVICSKNMYDDQEQYN